MNKDELLTAIAAAAEAAGVDAPDLEGKTDAELDEVLAGLQPAAATAPEKKAPEKKAPEKKAPEKKAPEKKAPVALPPFTVAKGKALTSKRGIIADGAEIRADDLAGGKEALADWVKRGYVDKN